MKTPRQLGEQAFASGRPCLPLWDQDLVSMLAEQADIAARFNQPAPDTLPTISAWLSGWKSAQGWAALNATRTA